ncbi:methyltransferase domain-containing protein [Actinokineospora diospyrosa]|uniref:Protein-L-isoaspartate O-methyltransferase n=1 Tax=Actinokineospora diospyrosa TaxID=103728 RepID=A0ABT1I8H7_9PSEU|nr:methyltransferase domain-containing protein [Actinokineospora diospyrosa]MCP2268933.1 methyltransferase, ATP-grasp peptide maturase system [Actinokineospora diospyrosa]
MTWQDLARELAAEIVAEGVLRTPSLRQAVEKTPRHLFVPRFYTQEPDRSWVQTAAGGEEWLAAVYRNQPLVTDLATTADGDRVTVSSSTKPGLMVRMLEALDLADHHRVLEIGTGTGYNAALLCHRLGDGRVFSVDIGAALVEAAGERLASLGLSPVLVVGHGGLGLPEHAPFDRIIATCSVPAVPRAWAGQVRVGGLVLVDLKPSVHAGNLALLRRTADGLTGRFLPRWAGFMAMRDADRAPDAAPALGDQSAGTRSDTTLPATPWTHLVPWFLAQVGMPGEVSVGYTGLAGGRPEWSTLSAADGSWAWARITGAREIRQGGPVRLWDRVEAAHDEWETLGCPDWDRLGLSVTPDGLHRVWLDEPDSGHEWVLPAR